MSRKEIIDVSQFIALLTSACAYIVVPADLMATPTSTVYLVGVE